MLEEDLTQGERLYLTRFKAKMNPKKMATALGVDLGLYLSWEADELEGPMLNVDLDPVDVFVILRFRSAWTQKEVARKMGISEEQIGRIERGLRPPDRLLHFWGLA